MKKHLTLCAITAVLLAFMTFGAQTLRAEETITHTVVKGDTLWSIANKYLKDSDKWKNLWKNNPDIKNPHLIRPGDIVKLTPDGISVERKGEVVANIPTPEPPAEETTPPPAKDADIKTSPFTGEITESPARDTGKIVPLSKVSSDSITRTGILSKEDTELVGKILVAADNMDKNLFAGRNVFLSMKDPDSVEVGDTFSVYKKGRKIKNPSDRSFVGYSVEFLGAVEITSKNENMIEAVITTAYREITPGDNLMSYVPPVKEVTVSESKVEVVAHIVGAYENTKELSKDAIIYLDKGFNDGLMDGNILFAYKDRKSVSDPMGSTKEIKLPSIEVGRLIVVKAYHNSSTAIIINSTQPLVAGDTVKNFLPDKDR